MNGAIGASISGGGGWLRLRYPHRRYQPRPRSTILVSPGFYGRSRGGFGGPQFRVRVQANAADPDDSEVFLSNGLGTYGWIRRPDPGGTFQFMFGVESVGVVARASASIVAPSNEMLLLAGGLLLNGLTVVIPILAVLSNLTALQRFWLISKGLRATEGSGTP